jgi:hypothetical protein
LYGCILADSPAHVLMTLAACAHVTGRRTLSAHHRWVASKAAAIGGLDCVYLVMTEAAEARASTGQALIVRRVLVRGYDLSQVDE